METRQGVQWVSPQAVEKDLDTELGKIDTSIANVNVKIENTNTNVANIKTDITAINEEIESINSEVESTKESIKPPRKSVTIIVGFTDDCDYKVIDTENAQNTINQAILALPAAGGKVVLREGTYRCTNGIIIENKVAVSFEGVGKSTIIQRTSNFDSELFRVSYSPNCFLKGFCLLGGRDLYNNYRSTIFIESSNDVTVTNCECWDSSYAGIRLSESNNVFVSENIIYNCVFGVFLRNGTHCTIVNNKTDANFNGKRSIELVNTSNNIITGNYVSRTTNVGIFADSHTSANVITNNQLFNNSDQGLSLAGSNNIVSSNYIKGGRVGIAIAGPGGASHNIIIGNKVSQTLEGIFNDASGTVLRGNLSDNRLVEN